MIKYLAHTFTVFVLFTTVIACNKYEPTIDPELIPYFDRFAEEAGLRGISFDYEDLEYEGFIQNLDALVGRGVLGFCQRIMVRQPYPTIYVDQDFWLAATDLEKEYVVFHEIGHCFLERDHQQPPLVDSLGNCMSIMAAGTAACNSLDVYTPERRSMLLDELFSN